MAVSRIVRIKNNTLSGGTWVGSSIMAGNYFDVAEEDITKWAADPDVFSDVASGNLIVNKGADNVDDIINPLEGWKWLIGDILPTSDLGNMLAVHPTTKPIVPGKEFYLVWTGSGDDVVNGKIGEGDLLAFAVTSSDATVSKDIRFDPQFGDIYIHEGYAKWYHDISVNNGAGDHMSAMIMADPTPLQQLADLDYVVEDDWVKLAPGGPGTGTHGLAGLPVLVPRTFMKDGDWDYDGANLTPNLAGTGLYKISSIERTVHGYINKVPMCFSSNGYDRLTSDETAYLPPGYFIRVTAYNSSASDWNCAFMFEVYRERTAVP